jgi:ribosomal protein S18 acetylase RimI-like enzyme
MRRKVRKNSMRESITFRPETDADRDFLLELYGSTRAEEMAIVPWSDEEKDRFVRMQFHAQTLHYKTHFSDAEFLIIEKDGAPIGRLYLHRTDEEGLLIVDISLLPAYRGQGIGRMLLEDIMARSASRGEVVSIHVENFNPALRLYQRLGFKQVSTYGVYYLMKWGTGDQLNTAS